MSQENVETVRRAFEAWEIAFERGTDELGALMNMFDDDVVTRRLAPGPDPGTWYGREGLLTVLAEWLETFDEFRMRGEEFIDAGDQVVLRVAQEARGEGSGAPVAATFWFVLGVRERKVATFDMYFSRDQALEAAGLSEQDAHADS